MLNKKLTTPMRWAWIASAVLGAGFLILFGTLAVVTPAGLPIWARIVFATGALFGLAWASLAGKIAWKGTINLKSHPTAAAGLAWGFTIIMVAGFMVVSDKLPDPIRGVQMVVNGLVFLIIAALFMIFNRVDQAELKTREKLLELECRLAELAELMGRRR